MEAIQDLMVQGITQALGTFLSPAQMGSSYGKLQEKILKQPERYVQTYQVFSESPSNGLYRIAGQVTIAMDTLKSDLTKLGLTLTEAEAPLSRPPAGVEEGPSASVPSATSEPVVIPGTGRPEEGPGYATGSMEGRAAERSILWVVAENWDGEWILPQDSQDPQSIFAMSAVQESHDYNWNLYFPESGSAILDAGGKLDSDRGLSLARTMGVETLVIGYVIARRGMEQGGDQLEATLHVFDVGSRNPEGEVYKRLALEGSSSQEGAIIMAALVIPELDHTLTGIPRSAPASSAAGPPAAQAAPGAGVNIPAGAPGEWTLLIQSDRQYAYWEELKKALLERFQSMEIASLELGPQTATVHLKGVDGDMAAALQGLQLESGAQVLVRSSSPELHSVEVTFQPPY